MDVSKGTPLTTVKSAMLQYHFCVYKDSKTFKGRLYIHIDIYKRSCYDKINKSVCKGGIDMSTEERIIWGYARVSTADQNLERQLQELRKYVTDDLHILKDTASGKNFDRLAYNTLVGTEKNVPMIQPGNLLIVTSLDRLGRNYIEIKEQWEHITKKLKADIKVLDMPLLDTSVSTDDLDRTFIADLVLQILSYTAQKERENIRIRQRQGIDIMPMVDGKRVSTKTGRPTGRPAAEYPQEWESIYKQWKNGQITAVKAMEILRVKKNTFYKLVKMYE